MDRSWNFRSVLLVLLAVSVSAEDEFTESSWPAGPAKDLIKIPVGDLEYKLLGVGFCRGGPPGGTIATEMNNYFKDDGTHRVELGSRSCMESCNRLQRCAGVEFKRDGTRCELQIPALRPAGNMTDQRVTDWFTGYDKVSEIAETGDWPNLVYDAKIGRPRALTTVKGKAGFFCWKKLVPCDTVSASVCEGLNRYSCEEGHTANACGPCMPLQTAEDGSDPYRGGMTQCVPDTSIKLPSLKIALGSPSFGVKVPDNVLFMTILYGAKKAWDEKHPHLIPMPVQNRIPFEIDIYGNTEQFGYTLSQNELMEYGYDESVWKVWEDVVDNHPLSGIRAMAALKRDAWTDAWALKEPNDTARTKPHVVIGSTNFKKIYGGLFPHSTIDIPLSHAASFFETPVLGWALQDRELGDKTKHPYYLRVNPVGFEFQYALSALMDYFGYKRFAIITSGVMKTQELLEQFGASFDIKVESMGLKEPCTHTFYEDQKCFRLLQHALTRLKNEDFRVVVYENDGVSHLNSYFVALYGKAFLNEKTLLLQYNLPGSCGSSPVPERKVTSTTRTIFDDIMTVATTDGVAKWENTWAGNCLVCPNFAFDLPESERQNRTTVALMNSRLYASRVHYPCPELLGNDDAFLECVTKGWCDPESRLWVAPSCDDELQDMQNALEGSLCIGEAHTLDASAIDRWYDYLSSLTAEDLVNAGAPKSFFDIFETTHGYYKKTALTLQEYWQRSLKDALRTNAALVDAMLLSMLAFNTWVRAEGDTTDLLTATQLRVGIQDYKHAAIPQWKRTLATSKFAGITGDVAFIGSQERSVKYTVYSAARHGEALVNQEIAHFDPEAFKTDPADVQGSFHFLQELRFKGGGASPPPDREPQCAPGTSYDIMRRGCFECEMGYFCDGDVSNTKRVAARMCQAGTFATRSGLSVSVGATECTPCKEGTFSDEGAAECTPCPLGMAAPKPASKKCSMCEAGFFQGEKGGTRCMPCPTGSYTNDIGKSECSVCSAGFTTVGQGSDSAGDCVCKGASGDDPGTFLDCDGCKLGSNESAGLQCKPCPAQMECAGPEESPLAMIIHLEGTSAHRMPYVPKGYMAQGEKVFVCAGNGDACPGAFMNEPVDKMCADGGDGIACAKCPAEKYFDGDSCSECAATSSLGIAVLVLIVIIGFVIFASSTFAVEPDGQYNHKTVLRRQHSSVISATLSQFISLLQTTWIMSKLAIKLPPSVAPVYSSTGGVFDLSAFQLACIGGLTPESFAVTRTVLLNAAPATVLLSAVICLIMAKMCPREGARKWPHVPEIQSSVIATIMLFFLAIVDCAVNTGMATTTHPCDLVTLRAFPYILVTDSNATTIRVASMFGVALWCVGFLSFMGFRLCQFRRKAGDLLFRRATLSMSIRYRKAYAWWSVVVLIQNLLVALTVSFFEDAAGQSIYLCLILVIYAGLVATFKPYFAPLVNYCDQASALGRALLMVVAPIYNASGEGEWMIVLLTILAYGLTGFCFAYSVYIFVRMKTSDSPTDLEFCWKDLEERLAKKLIGDQKEYIEAAKLAMEEKQGEFVWHDKLLQVKSRVIAKSDTNMIVNNRFPTLYPGAEAAADKAQAPAKDQPLRDMETQCV